MKDLRERLAAAGVHTLVAQFTDLFGDPKGAYLPLQQLDWLLTHGAAFAGASIPGTGLPRTGPRSELLVRGAASTISMLPWMPGYARVVCEGFVDGQPFESCPRQVLRRQVARLSKQGWHLRCGSEPEFYLLRRDPDGQDEPMDPADNLSQPGCDLDSLARQREFLHTLRLALEAAGQPIVQIDHVHGRGQYAIHLTPDEALASADHLMLLKLAGEEMAQARGIEFSLRPKPLPDQPGSGLPLQLMLLKGHGADARNLFVPHRRDGSIDSDALLAPLGEQFAAGVLAHSAALCALGAPAADGYLRLCNARRRAGQTLAPTVIAQGANNRTALLRVLHGRFEWRLPDVSANPYLMLAGVIAAGLDGIDQQMALPPGCDDDVSQLDDAEIAARGLSRLPFTLDAALDALEADPVVSGALGEPTLQLFVGAKRQNAVAAIAVPGA